MPEINPSRITFARVRRCLTTEQLAKALGITSRSIQDYESGSATPDSATVVEMALLLNFPKQFFYLEEAMPVIGEHAVSFRSLSKTNEVMRNCALSLGAIAFTLNDWIEERFNLPQADLPDLSDLPPEEAAATLRRMWGLGNAPISNTIHLLESKGIRVFSLAEEVREVDTFCTWHDGKPFVFLNTMKSAERSRFDAAHELGHFVRDVYSMRHGEARGIEMEREANAFAAAFLMPRESVVANKPPAFTIKYLLKLKHHWGVSLSAIVNRFNALRLVKEWAYRNLCIEIARSGFRTDEPEPMEQEASQLLRKILSVLQAQRVGRSEIARCLCVRADEINSLTFELARSPVASEGASVSVGSKRLADLRWLRPEHDVSL
ncbi:ImmA/IrrE family metallo-endopeptidase [Cupriavidus pauculus]|uniref:ImmA/IrrE family metallo-endopeptidase n=1 Tax=Cupriavidus pauculus TaxID=82633 RepID=A0A5P2H605_9BURK|nr:XRE family transcriptional regulator [Cupriavidus pauculus]QET03491.1 ImmA/IrrE family metallo-endopeptidase [Cupriavidus pauculus]